MPRPNIYTREKLEEAVKASTSFRQVLRLFDRKGTGESLVIVKRKVKEYGIDTSHFLVRSYTEKGRTAHKRTPEQVLIKLDPSQPRESSWRLRQALIETGRLFRCEWCSVGSTWNNKPLTLQVDHIDGDSQNNEAENLRFLCPNCHSQTDNFSLNKRFLTSCKARENREGGVGSPRSTGPSRGSRRDCRVPA